LKIRRSYAHTHSAAQDTRGCHKKFTQQQFCSSDPND